MSEVLVVTSKVKKYIKKEGGLSTAANVGEALTDVVKRKCDDAIENAKSDKRKTVMFKDFDQVKKFKVKKKGFKRKNPKTSKMWKENWPQPCSHHSSNVCCSTCHPMLWDLTEDEAKLYSTEALTIELKVAKKAYYDGNPILRDEEFDAMEGSLRAINPDAPVLQRVGT